MSTPKESTKNDIANTDEYEYLNLIYPPENIDLGRFIEKVYAK